MPYYPIDLYKFNENYIPVSNFNRRFLFIFQIIKMIQNSHQFRSFQSHHQLSSRHLHPQTLYNRNPRKLREPAKNNNSNYDFIIKHSLPSTWTIMRHLNTINKRGSNNYNNKCPERKEQTLMMTRISMPET